MLITVDVTSVIRKTGPGVIGLNTNFLTDHTDIRSAGEGYENALRRMGAKSRAIPAARNPTSIFCPPAVGRSSPEPVRHRLG
jgi:hypothetical protein